MCYISQTIILVKKDKVRTLSLLLGEPHVSYRGGKRFTCAWMHLVLVTNRHLEPPPPSLSFRNPVSAPDVQP